MSRQKIGNYELVRHLATGGMADVFLARLLGPAGFEKLVVIKLLLPHLARDPVYREMLLAEARLAATLRHANIVQVIEVSEHRGRYFIAMEYLHGKDLGRVTARLREDGVRMPLDIALQVMIATLTGLHHAHERRLPDGTPAEIVHRDVSPQNIFLTYDGQVKLVDFGVAKAAESDLQTKTGVLKGKLGYMAPEQARAEAVDRRADVFAAAIVLWELLCGQRLFQRASEYLTLRAVIEEDAPPPSSARADIPPALEDIVVRGLARERGRRFARADEMRCALEAFACEQGLVLMPGKVGEYLGTLFPREAESDTALAPASTSTAVTAMEGATAGARPARSPGAYRWRAAVLALALLSGLVGAAAWVRARWSAADRPPPSAVEAQSSGSPAAASPPPPPVDSGASRRKTPAAAGEPAPSAARQSKRDAARKGTPAAARSPGKASRPAAKSRSVDHDTAILP